ncbi:hypothetical protein BpHYR1_046640 [Brachionus plicatilis]|uniref:Uncharacterized protein n=1 Tax=Brachionus plicatilis TaxID=10195 RepID=A0A3M7RVG3_BRAPC|nr:hypothetical protein BpHYR1_046640 [Brachionus plicatilis]
MKESDLESITNFEVIQTHEATLVINRTIKAMSNKLIQLDQNNQIVMNHLNICNQENQLKEQTISNLKLILNKKINELKLTNERLENIKQENQKKDQSIINDFAKEIMSRATLLGSQEAKLECYKTLIQ